MASKLKPLCKFGESCYRKNPQHLRDFRHPHTETDTDSSGEKPAKKAKLDGGEKQKPIGDFFSKASDNPSRKAAPEEVVEDFESPGGSADSDKDAGTDEEAETKTPPPSPDDVKANIKQKFLVDMPEDFYQFWDFCKSENSTKPTDALLKTLGLQLVGPFDILAGTHKGVTRNRHGKRPNYLLHWRYYYDPPEFQTVIKGDDRKQFHMGYFRDDPNESPAFVASNEAAVDGVITPKGDNLFAAVYNHIDDRLKAKGTDASSKPQLKDLQDHVKTWAQKNGYSVELRSKSMKERDKKVVCKTFHKAGIVVPVDENEVGYREVPETPADLKKMFRKIVESGSAEERDRNYEPLQELITLVQFANDECDYGEGLELGMDLFSYGGNVFHTTISQLLPLAYMLLNRNEFGTIVEAHLKHRRKGADLSQL